MLSIFRQSESYLPQYLKQILDVFEDSKGKCGVIWLEGDSIDKTYDILLDAKKQFEGRGHYVNLIKYDCGGPHWGSIADKKRWLQLATCWNTCLNEIVPAKYTVCVESDLVYDANVVSQLILKLDDEHNVIYPMLMAARSLEIFPKEIFYDIWGFSRGGKKFVNFFPYYDQGVFAQEENDELLELTTGGGMIVSTYQYQKDGRFDAEDCIMKYPNNTKLFMHKLLKIYHPAPSSWNLK
jgi:hypothetical protein